MLKKFFCTSNQSFTLELFKAIENMKKIQIGNLSAKKYKSRYNGKSKRRCWQNYDGEVDNIAAEKLKNFKPEDRVKRKKQAILIGYCGANYFGMQRNPGQKTIEEDILKAMLTCKWIKEDEFNQPQQIQFQRAARTDKGVSAARQICSLKLPNSLNLEEINSKLPEDIRIFAAKRVTKGFNSKDNCNARTYTYTMPTIALDPQSKYLDYVSYRLNDAKLTYFRKILNHFEGTKNFHNFTNKKSYLDPSSKRFIMSFECNNPQIQNNLEFITCCVKGQSFMVHQIRKMVGLAILIARGIIDEDILEIAFSEKKVGVPMAPGLGLVLDKVHYDRYNERYGMDGIHEPLTWENEESLIQEFMYNFIFPTIFETETKGKSMLNWLEDLIMDSYGIEEATL